MIILHVVALFASYENGRDEQLWVIDRASEVYDVDAPEKRQDKFVQDDAIPCGCCGQQADLKVS